MTWLRLKLPSRRQGPISACLRFSCSSSIAFKHKDRCQPLPIPITPVQTLHKKPMSHHGVIFTFQNWIQLQTVWFCIWVFVGKCVVIAVIASCHVMEWSALACNDSKDNFFCNSWARTAKETLNWPLRLSSSIHCNIWVFPKIEIPQNGWFIMENRKTLLKWMIWRYPHFGKHPNHCITVLNTWYKDWWTFWYLG